MNRLLCALLLLFTFALPHAAAQEVTQVDLINVEGVLPQHIFPAPDGHHIAYQSAGDANQFCVQDVLTAEETCFDLPENFPNGLVPRLFFQPLRWSPDSTKIAVVGQPLIYFKDTDLWIIDVQAGTLTNLTDDQYEGEIFLEGKPGATLFSEPTWSPDSTTIAVEYTVVNDEGRLGQSTIALVNASTGEITELSLLPGHQEYDIDAGSVLAFSWSPDGTRIAFSLRHSSLEPAYDGIWAVDVEDGELRPMLSIITAQRAVEAIAPGANFFAAGPILWSESHMMVWIGDANSFEGFQWCFWLNPNIGTLEPIKAPMPEDPHGAFFMQATWSPDGDTLLLATRHLTLMPDEEAISLDPTNDAAEVSLRLIDPAAGTSTLLGYLPFVPGIPFTAAWGPDGNIIIDGYHLTLAE